MCFHVEQCFKEQIFLPSIPCIGSSGSQIPESKSSLELPTCTENFKILQKIMLSEPTL